MTVIAFSVARFTPDDIARFNAVAASKLDGGLWESTQRESGKAFDRILIRFPGLSRPVFSFERDQWGTYHVWYHDNSGAHPVGQGATAEDCLAVWVAPPLQQAAMHY